MQDRYPAVIIWVYAHLICQFSKFSQKLDLVYNHDSQKINKNVNELTTESSVLYRFFHEDILLGF
jgi:hypothetical protein